MAFYRKISMSFWTDAKIVDDFTPEDRYFYLYLFTNPHTNLCGCYEISFTQMANETGYNKDSVERLIRRFADIHKINELNNFVLPVQVSKDFLAELFSTVSNNPKSKVRVDVPRQTVTNVETGRSEEFELNPYKKYCLMNALDDIDFLLLQKNLIEDFENNR